MRSIVMAMVSCVLFQAVSAQAAIYLEEDGLLVIEAEHYAYKEGDGLHYWEFMDNTQMQDVRGDGFMIALPDLNTPDGGSEFINGLPGQAPLMRYDFQIVNPGTYTLYTRATGYDGHEDSVYITLDNRGDYFNQSVPQTDIGSFAGTWDYQALPNDPGTGPQEPMEFTLDAGMHSLCVSMRQDGTMIDTLALTMDDLPDDPNESPIVPEPATFLLLSAGALIRRRRGGKYV